jgi:hypothetical protein
MKKLLLAIAAVLIAGCDLIETGEPVTNSIIPDLEAVCIEGHVYYYTPGFHRGGIAPKLNDDGTPCQCQ